MLLSPCPCASVLENGLFSSLSTDPWSATAPNSCSRGPGWRRCGVVEATPPRGWPPWGWGHRAACQGFPFQSRLICAPARIAMSDADLPSRFAFFRPRRLEPLGALASAPRPATLCFPSDPLFASRQSPTPAPSSHTRSSSRNPSASLAAWGSSRAPRTSSGC